MNRDKMDRASTSDALRRVVIESVQPEINCGRFPIKRTIGEAVVVEADIFADGHQLLAAALLYRADGSSTWRETPMHLMENDRWRGQFRVSSLEPFLYTLQAWIDSFKTWTRDLAKKHAAGQDISMDLLIGAEFIFSAGLRAEGEDGRKLNELAAEVKAGARDRASALFDRVRGSDLEELMARYSDRASATTYRKELRVIVNRERARFGSWYEMFPRSSALDPQRHGTFRDCIKRLGYIADMGFDILYLPPIHPISRVHRKGKNNSEETTPNDPGSPWAIGSEQGGHKAIHPQLGTLDDFKELRNKAHDCGLEIALDLAYQCAPDHPYVKEHKNWFRERPDGSVQYAENPPKKYEDIYPLNFESEDSRALAEELKSIVLYWIAQGVRIFRVDNPHTKPFEFWKWLIGEINRDHPDVIFLAEAFTRPKVMYRLAKLGFTQSYTYFAWKNTKSELMEYFTELTQTSVRQFFRGNLWPNTPDILNEYLQQGGKPAFMARLILAATLGASYGIYGPAFELCENRPLKPGSEEYLDSEKYQVRAWDVDREGSLALLVGRVNKIRREHSALQGDWTLRFHSVDNEQLISYSKRSDDGEIVVVVVNLDSRYTQSGWLELPLAEFGLPANESYEVRDLLTDARYLWRGPRNYVELNPSKIPAHILKVR